MTKEEAIQAMKEGKRVTHHWFSPTEWMEGFGRKDYRFEDGVVCSYNEFWRWRDDASWEDGWSVFE
jgi:hypothetical protein